MGDAAVDEYEARTTWVDPPWPDGWWLVALLVLAASAALMTILATWHGAGLEPDSVAYISSARNLVSGNGLHPVHGSTLTIFPPGYPVILAAGHLVGTDAGTVARILNIVAAPAIVLLAYVLLSRHIHSMRVALIGTVFVTLAPALLR